MVPETIMTDQNHNSLKRNDSMPSSDASTASDKSPDKIVSIEVLNTKGQFSEGRFTCALILAVFACTFGSSFQFGYHIGCVNAPGALITSWYQESYYDINKAVLTDDDAKNYWSFSVGIFAIGGMVGGLASGWFADKLGRKNALLANNSIAVIGGLFMTFAKPVGLWYLLLIGRLIIGINAGLNSGLAPLYLTEISPANLRGTIGSVHQLFVTIAILVSQILGLRYIFGTAQLWPYIFAFTIVPVIVQLLVLPFCPESPKYTLITKGQNDQAEKDLKKLRNQEDVSAEMESINDEATTTRSQPKVTFGNMFGVDLRWPLFIAVMMMFSQQLSGINAAMFYSNEIFKAAGLTGDAPFYATIGMGAVNVCMTVVSVWLVDHPKFGRRSLHLIGLTGMLISTLLLTAALSFVPKQSVPNPTDITTTTTMAPEATTLATIASYASILLVILFVVFFATGPGSIPWFYVSEIFPSGARGNAVTIAVLANWTANFLVSVSFLPLQIKLQNFVFLIFSAILAFFVAFTFKFIPETKGKSVEEIHAEMKRK